MMAHPADGRAERILTDIALPLVEDIREDLDASHRTVRNLDRADLEALACILAALIPPTIPVDTLAWWRFPAGTVKRPKLRPCGTHAAYGRHRARGERPCAPCTMAEREYSTAQKRARRVAARSQKAKPPGRLIRTPVADTMPTVKTEAAS